MSLLEIIAYDLYLCEVEETKVTALEWYSIDVSRQMIYIRMAGYVLENYVSKDTVRSAIVTLLD